MRGFASLFAVLVALLACDFDALNQIDQLEFKPECESDDDCPEGELCISGWWPADGGGVEIFPRCSRGACTQNEDCGEAKECRLRDPDNESVTRKSCLALRCSCAADCPSGWRCGSGSCHVVGPEDTTCLTDDDCDPKQLCELRQAATCDPPGEGLCVARLCSNDSYCVLGQICCVQYPIGKCIDPDESCD